MFEKLIELIDRLDQIQSDHDFNSLDEAYRDHVNAFWNRVAEGREERNEPPPLVVGESWEDAADVVARFNADIGYEAIKISQALARKHRWRNR